MKYSDGDLIDKASIVYRKLQAAPNKELEQEYSELIKGLGEKGKIIEATIQITNSNADIWALEADIRNGGKMSLEEIGKRALQIRDTNTKRIEARNTINKITSTGYVEVKIDHMCAVKEKPIKRRKRRKSIEKTSEENIEEKPKEKKERKIKSSEPETPEKESLSDSQVDAL